MEPPALEPPEEADIIHGDPIFKHNGVGLKFTMPIAKVVDLLAWHGAAGEKVTLTLTLTLTLPLPLALTLTLTLALPLPLPLALARSCRT